MTEHDHFSEAPVTTPAVDPYLLAEHPERIPGYTYRFIDVASSPLTMNDLDELIQTVGLTADDRRAPAEAAPILAPQADAMVTRWREQKGHHPFLARYSAHPDGRPNPEYSAASKPRFDRWIIDACTRPLDRAWLDYEHQIGLRHTRNKKNHTDHADHDDDAGRRELSGPHPGRRLGWSRRSPTAQPGDRWGIAPQVRSSTCRWAGAPSAVWRSGRCQVKRLRSSSIGPWWPCSRSTSPVGRRT